MTNPSIGRRRLLRCVAATAVAVTRMPAYAQAAFPEHAIRWIVGYAAGGGSDFTARVVAEAWSKKVGQAVIVENHPGANTAMAAAEVAHAKPDGYTVGFTSNGTLVLNPLLYRHLQYDISDFKPVSLMGLQPVILVVPASAGIHSAPEFIAHVKANPGKLSYGSPGIGNPAHLAMELLKAKAGLAIVHVPYRGAAPAIADLVAGQTQAMMVDYATGAPFLKSGQLRPLAVAGSARLPQVPDAPTFVELGYKDVQAAALQGVSVPKNTPDSIVAALSAQLSAAVRSEAVSKRLFDYGIQPVGSTPDEFAKALEADRNRWKSIVDDLALKLD